MRKAVKMRKNTFESKSQILLQLSPLFVFSLMIDATVQPFFYRSKIKIGRMSNMTVYMRGLRDKWTKAKSLNPFSAIKKERGKVNSKLAVSELLRCEILKFYSKNIHSHSSSYSFLHPAIYSWWHAEGQKCTFCFLKEDFNCSSEEIVILSRDYLWRIDNHPEAASLMWKIISHHQN